MPYRLLAQLGALLAAATLCVPAALGAGDPIAEINALRAERGMSILPTVNAPELQAALGTAHDAGGAGETPTGLPPCRICSADDGVTVDGSTRSIYRMWADAGGSDGVIAITLTGSARDTFNAYPLAAAYLLNGTADAILAAPAAGAHVLLVGTTGTAPTPLQVWPAGVVDLSRPALIWGGSSPTLRVTPTGGRLAGRGGQVDAGITGPWNAWNMWTVPIGANASYTVTSGDQTLALTTAPIAPGAPVFTNLTATQRRTFLRSFRSSPSLGREFLAMIGQRLSISHKRGGSEGASVAGGAMDGFGINFNTAHLTNDVTGRFIMQHEFGHIVMFAGLDDEAMTAFETLLKRTGRYRCQPYSRFGGPRKACVPLVERFADEYARWALGKPLRIGIYNTPPLLKRAQMTRFLREHFTRRASPPMGRDGNGPPTGV